MSGKPPRRPSFLPRCILSIPKPSGRTRGLIVRSCEAATSRPSPIRPTRSCYARGRRPAPLGGLLGDEGGLCLPCWIWAGSPLAHFVPSRGWVAGRVEATRGGKTQRPRVQGGRGARWRHRRSGACWLAWNGSAAEALIGTARGGVPCVFPLFPPARLRPLDLLGRSPAMVAMAAAHLLGRESWGN